MNETDYRDQAQLTPYQQRTLLELRRRNRQSLEQARGKRYELLRNAARIEVRHPAVADCRGAIPIHVDVRSTFGGHSFPTGFTAERQLWISVEVRDPTGRIVYRSGDLDDNFDLRDDHSHAVLAGRLPFDRDLLNFQSKFVALTSKGTERLVVLSVNRHLQPLNVLRPAAGIAASFGRPPVFRIAKGSLPPLAVMGQTYHARLPELAGPYTLDVQLNFRHLPPVLLDYIGTPHLKHLLEIVVVDRYQGVVMVQPVPP